MREMNQSAVYRLNTLLTLFQVNRAGAAYSISELAKLLNVPSPVVRKDILMLYRSKEFGTTFFPKDEEEDTDDFMERLEAGTCDDVLLEAETIYKNDVFVSLTQMQLSCLDEFLETEEFDLQRMHRNYVIKPLYNQAWANMQVKVQEMNDVIQAEETIRIHYRTRKGDLVLSTICPLKLVHNAMDDLYYVVTIKDGKLLPLRLDRISQYEISKEKIKIDDKTPLNQLPNIWGMEVGEKVHVKMKILKEANVVEKIRRDLAVRVNGVWSEEEDAVYFEDDVIGIHNFRSWVNSYGSSILILEPKSLREMILESARKRLEFYLSD